MSHFTCLVIGNNPEDQLAPYDENIEVAPQVRGDVSEEEKQSMIDHYKSEGIEYPTFDELYKNKGGNWNGNTWSKQGNKWVKISTYNPNSKWDWYQLGGRWTGFLKLKEGTNGVVGEPSLISERRAKPGYVDVAAKKDIDFEGMKNLAGEKASKEYDEVMSLIGHTEPNTPWSDFVKRVENKEISIDVARKEYHAQPRLVEASKHKEKLGYFFEADEYLVSKEKYVEDARNSAITTFAVLKDGVWYEKGKMGWFAMVSDEQEQGDWNKKINELIDSVDDDTLISIYDCHI